MARNTFIGEAGWGIEIVDLNRSMEKFVKTGAKEIKKRLQVPVLATAFRLQQRMSSMAPEGPDAPHIKNTVTFKHRGLRAEVGYLAEDFGAEPAADGSTASIADVARYNEYNPNNQAFMLPAATLEAKPFVQRMIEAVQSAERALSRGVL
jgi:hypothetical protein